jgi:hypothetical protein
MQVTTAREQKQYATQPHTVGYADKQHDTTTLGQQTTLLLEIQPAHSRLHTDPVTAAGATDHQAQRPSTPTRHSLFSYAAHRGTLTPRERTYPRINLFFWVPDSADWSLSGVLSVWRTSPRYLRPSFVWTSPRALEQAGV